MPTTTDTSVARLNVALETERIISDGLNRGDASVLSHVTAPFLDDLWEAIRSRRLGPYAGPSPVEKAAALAFGTFRGDILAALSAAEQEFPDPSETWGKPILAVLRAATAPSR